MGDWPIVRIENIATKIAMGPFGSNIKVSTFVESGIPVISGQHLHGIRLNENAGFNFVTPEHAEKLKNSNVYPQDVIFTHAGSIGQVSLIPETSIFSRYVISQRQFYLRLDRSKAEPLFVTYWFHAPIGRHRLLMHASQVGVPSISRPATNLKAIQIELPPLPEQRAIAAVLCALDDKIELNRRMNATLERQARALFADWFTHFGPTRAKAAGKPPYLAPEIWSLFPDRLDENGVPEGWEEKCVRDILELSYGKSLPKKTRIAGNIPVYGSGGITGTHNEALVKEPTIIVGRKGTVGSLYWQPTPCFPIDTVFYVKTEESLVFCYYLLQTLGLNTMNTDAAVPGLNRDNAYRLPVIWASEPIRKAFDNLLIPLRERIDANELESRTLAQTRDLLLPRLMSGELRVREGEGIVEGVG